MKNIIIIGAGFSGSTAAYLLTKKGHNVTVIESASHPGGGCWTRYHGKHPYTIGPRIFYTTKKHIFEFLDSFVKIRAFDTKTLSYIHDDNEFYNYPLQQKDLPRMPDCDKINMELDQCGKQEQDFSNFKQYWLTTVGPTLYRKFIKNYSKKMWSIFSNSELSANFKWVNRGTPIRDGDTRLFGDQFQGYPFNETGYNDFFIKTLNDSDLVLNEKVENIEKSDGVFTVTTDSSEYNADIVINTGHTDEVFGFKYGKLGYSGRDILKVVLPTDKIIDKDYHWVHYSGDEPYTRITDFNKITNSGKNGTLLTIEIPSDSNRLYPKQIQSELCRYQQYVDGFPENYYAIGRLGTFKYTGITDAIEQAMNLVEELS